MNFFGSLGIRLIVWGVSYKIINKIVIIRKENSMICPPIAKQTIRYLESELPKLKNTQNISSCCQTIALEDRACSSLCELSANICREEEETGRTIQEGGRVQKYSCSPWKIKKGDVGQGLAIKQRKRKNTQKQRQRQQNQRCNTQNKQNVENHKKNQSEARIKKNNSIFFKIVGLREGKDTVNFKSEHPDIEMIACVQKKKFSVIQMKRQTAAMKNQVGVQVNRQITPKVVTLEHSKQYQNFKAYPKKLNSSLLSNWSQEFKQGKDGYPYTDHWKGKKRSKKGNVCKKIVVVRESKSIEAREIRDTYLVRKKGSVSLDRTKKQDYKSNNPLTRLLYEKYLHTIGMCHTKEISSKFI